MGGLASIPCCGCRQNREKSLKGLTQAESLPRPSQTEAMPNASTNQVWEEGVTEPLPPSQESNQLSRADTNGFGVENDSIYGLSVIKDTLELFTDTDTTADVSDDEDADSSDSFSDNGTDEEAVDHIGSSTWTAHSRHEFSEYRETEELSEARYFTHMPGGPYLFFTSSGLPEGKVLAVYKSLLDKPHPNSTFVQSLKSLNLDGKSAVIMIGGGHFAAAIIDHRRGKQNAASISNPFATIQIIESKTFHRYTTRRKQGGSQSASDNTRGKAYSAGSSLRRANELALQQEVRNLLEKWASLLKDCYRIFYRATGKYNRSIIMGYKGAPIAKDDPRLQSIPLTTKRPTLAEVQRAWTQLTKAQVFEPPAVTVSKSDLIQKQMDVSTTRDKTVLSETQKAVAFSKEVEETPEEVKLSLKISDLIRKSRLKALKEVFEQHNLSYDMQLQPLLKFSPACTPLLFAASLGKHHVVSSLLDWGADPTIKAENGLSLGDLARDFDLVMETLQISRERIGENAWDWDAAQVGPPRTKEQIEEERRTAFDKERELLRQQRKDQAAREKQIRMERLISNFGGGRRLGNSSGRPPDVSEDEHREIERERRARAAEARALRFQNR